jgi:hypothetical protein
LCTGCSTIPIVHSSVAPVWFLLEVEDVCTGRPDRTVLLEASRRNQRVAGLLRTRLAEGYREEIQGAALVGWTVRSFGSLSCHAVATDRAVGADWRLWSIIEPVIEFFVAQDVDVDMLRVGRAPYVGHS